MDGVVKSGKWWSCTVCGAKIEEIAEFAIDDNGVERILRWIPESKYWQKPYVFCGPECSLRSKDGNK